MIPDGPPGLDDQVEPSKPVESTKPTLEDIIPGILPAGEAHLLSGASGAGKTALLAWVLACIRDGVPLFGYKTRTPSFIGVITADRPWKDHLKWFEAVGFPEIPHYSLVDDLKNISGAKIRAMDRGQLFRDCIERLCGSTWPQRDSLIAVDPGSLFIGGNLLDYDKCATHLIDIQQFCIRTESTIPMTMHASKQKADPKQQYKRPQDRISGTAAQTGHTGTAFHLAPPEEIGEEWYEFTAVPHHAPAFTLKMERNETGLFVPMDAKRAVAVDPLERLLSIIPAEEVKVTEVCNSAWDALRIGKSQFYAHLGELVKQGRVTRVRHGVIKSTLGN